MDRTMTPLTKAAKAAFECYANAEGITMTWNDLTYSAQYRWRAIATVVLDTHEEAMNIRKKEGMK